jgi:hypothetical protein
MSEETVSPAPLVVELQEVFLNPSELFWSRYPYEENGPAAADHIVRSAKNGQLTLCIDLDHRHS